MSSHQSSFAPLPIILFVLLFAATIVHLPTPLFREVFFEEVRNRGPFVFIGWILLFFLSLFSNQNRRRFVMLSAFGMVLMTFPILPFGFRELGAAFSDPHDEEMQAASQPEDTPIRVDIRQGVSSFTDLSTPRPFEQLVVVAFESPKLGQDAIPGWAACFQSFQTSKRNPAFLLMNFPCEDIFHFELVASHIPAIRIDIPSSSQDVPLYVIVDEGGGTREAFYHNYLAMRRLVARLRYERNAIVILDSVFTPWSKIYRSLGSGGKLIDSAWGEWDFFGNMSARIFKTESVFFKGVHLANKGDFSFTFQRGES